MVIGDDYIPATSKLLLSIRICQISRNKISHFRQRILEKNFPKCFRPRTRVTTQNLPRAYHLYKAKCCSENSGLTCTKPHAHYREIVADAKNTARTQSRLIAKAIRATKLLSEEFTWALWRQCDIQEVTTNRFRRLKAVPCFKHFLCRCGGNKHPTSILKSQFFKAADLSRGLDRINEF